MRSRGCSACKAPCNFWGLSHRCASETAFFSSVKRCGMPYHKWPPVSVHSELGPGQENYSLESLLCPLQTPQLCARATILCHSQSRFAAATGARCSFYERRSRSEKAHCCAWCQWVYWRGGSPSIGVAPSVCGYNSDWRKPSWEGKHQSDPCHKVLLRGFAL